MKKVISVFLAIIMVIGMLEGMAITTLAVEEVGQIVDKIEAVYGPKSEDEGQNNV